MFGRPVSTLSGHSERAVVWAPAGRNRNGRFGEATRRSRHLRPDGAVAAVSEPKADRLSRASYHQAKQPIDPTCFLKKRRLRYWVRSISLRYLAFLRLPVLGLPSTGAIRTSLYFRIVASNWLRFRGFLTQSRDISRLKVIVVRKLGRSSGSRVSDSHRPRPGAARNRRTIRAQNQPRSSAACAPLTTMAKSPASSPFTSPETRVFAPAAA